MGEEDTSKDGKEDLIYNEIPDDYYDDDDDDGKVEQKISYSIYNKTIFDNQTSVFIKLLKDEAKTYQKINDANLNKIFDKFNIFIKNNPCEPSPRKSSVIKTPHPSDESIGPIQIGDTGQTPTDILSSPIPTTRPDTTGSPIPIPPISTPGIYKPKYDVSLDVLSNPDADLEFYYL